MTTVKIYLASKSPRRQELLRQINVDFILLDVEIDESQQANENPLAYVKRMAKQKAESAWQNNQRKQNLPLLAADTCIEFDGKVLGKPESKEQAYEMLKSLSGNQHWVHTSVAVKNASKIELQVSTTKVVFANIQEDVLQGYVASGDGLDKAGAYGIQGFAGQFVSHMSGSYTGVVGLPLHETSKLLEGFSTGFVDKIIE